MNLFGLFDLFIIDKGKLLAKITIVLVITTGYTVFVIDKYDNLSISTDELGNLDFSSFIPGQSSVILDIRVTDPNDPPGSASIDCTKEFLKIDTYDEYIIVLLQYSCLRRLSIYDSTDGTVTLSIDGYLEDFLITDSGMLILPNQPRSQVYIWKDIADPNSFFIEDFEYTIDKHSMKYHQLTDSIYFINSDNRVLIQYKIDKNESIEIDEMKLFSFDIQKNSKIIAFRPFEWSDRSQIRITDLDSNWTLTIENDVTINKLMWVPNTNRLIATATQKEELILFDLMIDNRTFKEIGRIRGEPQSTLGNIQQLFSIDPNANYLALSTSRSRVIDNNGGTSYTIKLELININSYSVEEILYNKDKMNYMVIKDLKWFGENEILMVKNTEIIRIMVN